ncbi:hypothetical protein K440DRAFT_616892 [Wilcoxina mikolae CBS 423.85]|nr:hypothetical protein K440DRAFT_616892 [Wilcoxina mikolae CBS 423.85]
MASRKRPEIYRVTGIPSTFTSATLKSALSERLPYEGEEYIQITANIVPSCVHNSTNTALVSFIPHPPVYLDSLSNGTTEIYTLRTANYGALAIDKNMYGLTQLYTTTPGERIVADIVAVTKIAGHAYGSWQAAGDFPQMWLRDFLAEDFPNCRTMTYGYNSKLESAGIHQTIDYNRSFLAEVAKARATPEETARPLILIGHSFGGIIIAQSLVRSMDAYFDGDTVLHSICLATQAIFFFGTPHRGLLLPDDILSAIDKDNHGERATLVESIGKDSVDRFLGVARRFDFKIYSFYEQLKTRKLVKGADGCFRRTGDYYVVVDSDSALLNLDSVEKRIPVDADHSSMVKFGFKHLHPYTEVAKYLRNTLNEILEKKKARELMDRRLMKERYRVLLDARDQEVTRLEDNLSNLSISSQKEQQSLQEQVDMWKEKYGALAKLYSKLRNEHLSMLGKYKELKLAKEPAGTVQQVTGVFEPYPNVAIASSVSSTPGQTVCAPTASFSNQPFNWFPSAPGVGIQNPADAKFQTQQFGSLIKPPGNLAETHFQEQSIHPPIFPPPSGYFPDPQRSWSEGGWTRETQKNPSPGSYPPKLPPKEMPSEFPKKPTKGGFLRKISPFSGSSTSNSLSWTSDRPGLQ